MKYLNFMPGPSQLSEETKQDIRQALEDNISSISHRSQEFNDIFKNAVENVKKFLEIPAGYEVFFTASATECMEILSRGCAFKKSFHFVNGSFSKKFMSLSQDVKNETEKREVAVGAGFDYTKEELPEELPELVSVNYTETPTGVSLDPKELKIFREKYPEVILAVDIVSAAGTLKIDFNLADAWFFSVQKGFGLPAGLGVLIVNQKVIKKAEELDEKGKDIGGCHSLVKLAENAEKNQTFETPNVLGIYLLAKVAGRFAEEGIEKIEAETKEKAKLLYDWAADQELGLCCKKEKYRALSVLCAQFPQGVKAADFHAHLNQQGIWIGNGYKEMKETHFRIANFPAHTKSDLEQALKAIGEYFKSV